MVMGDRVIAPVELTFTVCASYLIALLRIVPALHEKVGVSVTLPPVVTRSVSATRSMVGVRPSAARTFTVTAAELVKIWGRTVVGSW